MLLKKYTSYHLISKFRVTVFQWKCLLIKVICLFGNYRRYKDWEKGNTATSICWWFSLTIIWKDQFFFIFDFYSHNETGFHGTSGNMVLQKYSTISSVNNYIKSFYENSVSFENQYDLQYVSEKNGSMQNWCFKHSDI